MTAKAPDLEQRLAAASRQDPFKSAGERRIAEFLQVREIHYDYERPLLVLDRGQPRIWYPDFYLPELAVYLEYFGIVADEGYDRRAQHKKSVYEAMDLDVIPLYPATFHTDWKGYILDSLEKIMARRQSTLAKARGECHRR